MPAPGHARSDLLVWGQLGERGAPCSAKGRRLGAFDPAIEAPQRVESAGLSWGSDSCRVVRPSTIVDANCVERRRSVGRLLLFLN